MLDGLRGFGAILVLFGHTIYYWGLEWSASGVVIVDLFFVLSGFVLAYAYEPRFAAGMGAREFMTHRIVRLYPLYLLGTLIGFAIFMAAAVGDADGQERTLSYVLQLIPQLFMLPSPEVLGTEDVYSFNVPAWTLFFELVVNLVYVLAFRWLRHTWVLVMVVAGCALALIYTVFYFGSIDAGPQWDNFVAGFARAGFGFFAGVLGYRLLGSPRTAKRPEKKSALIVVVLLPIICLTPATEQMRPFVDIALAMLLSLPLLWVAQSMGPPARFNALFTIGGRISYAVYILHQPFRELAARAAWHDINLYSVAPLSGIVIMILAVSLAYFAERYYDRPVRRWIVAKLRQRAASRGASAPAAAEPKSSTAFAE
ncbi:MAG TPA: acyltransferase [Hyphomonadaceae bacterium]